MITSSLQRGGSELQFTQVAIGLGQLGWDVRVISLQPGGAYEGMLRQNGVIIRTCQTGRIASPASFWRLKREIRRSSPDLVLTQAFRANLWGRFAAISQGRRVVASVRATYSYLPPAYFPVERMLGRRSAAVITPSRATTRFMIDRVGVPGQRLMTIPNGVEASDFQPEADGAGFRKKWAIPEGILILAAGRLVPQKNFPGVLDAFGRASSRIPGATLIIAGSGRERRELESLAGQRGLACRFVGELNRVDMAMAFGAADCVCSLSQFEGMPNVVLEAMAAGRAIVVAEVDGVPELIEHGVSGLLVPPNHTQAAADALVELGTSRALRGRLGLAARAKVMADYSVAKNIQRHADLLDGIASGN